MMQLQPTGRRYATLTGELAEEVDPRRVGAPRYTVLTFDARYRALPALRAALAVGRSFLEAPMVPGIVPLVLADIEGGRLVYATGEVWSLAEVLDAARARRASPSSRAAAELGWWVSNLLHEASEAGASAGVFAHGDLSPWRVLLRADGDIALLGYGVPDVEVLRVRQARADGSGTPTCRYAPPERMVGRPEDVRSDLYALGLVMAEVATGKPLAPLEAEQAWKVARDAGHRGLWDAVAGKVPKPLADVIRRMLAPTPTDRLDATEVIRRLAAVLADLEGDGLDVLAGEHASDDARRARSPHVRPLEDLDADDRRAAAVSAPLQARRVELPTEGGQLLAPAAVAARAAPRRAVPRPSAPSAVEGQRGALAGERPVRASSGRSASAPTAPAPRPAPPAASADGTAAPVSRPSRASAPLAPLAPTAPTAPTAAVDATRRPARASAAIDADDSPEDDPTA
jgi:hypothetical protein